MCFTLLTIIFLLLFRQLLSGVENLRVMAASLENTERIVDQTDVDFLTECDDDLGPAL